jgi:hypothetical protein
MWDDMWVWEDMSAWEDESSTISTWASKGVGKIN